MLLVFAAVVEVVGSINVVDDEVVSVIVGVVGSPDVVDVVLEVSGG